MRLPKSVQKVAVRIHGGKSNRQVRAELMTLMLCLTFVLNPFTATQIALAQDDEGSSSSEQKKLEALKLKAQAQEAIAKARRAEMEAKFPKASSNPLDGKTTRDGDFIEGQIVAHLSVAEAADGVAKQLHAAFPRLRVLAVHNTKDINLVMSYRAADRRIDALEKRYAAVIEEEEKTARKVPELNIQLPMPKSRSNFDRALSLPLALGAGTSTLGSFVDFLSFLRTDVDLEGTAYDVTEDVFVSELFRSLRTKYVGGINLYYPVVVPPNIGALKSSMLLGKIELLYKRKDEAEHLEREIKDRIAKKQKQVEKLNQLIAEEREAQEEAHNDRINSLRDEAANLRKTASSRSRITNRQKEAEAERLQTADATLPQQPTSQRDTYAGYIAKLEEDIANLTPAARHLPGVNAQFELLLKDLLKVDEGSGISLISGYIQTESLMSVMNQDEQKSGGSLASDIGEESYWLTLGVIKAGGNIKIKRNLILDVFRGGSRVLHGGGAIVKYNLFDRSGASKLSGTVGRYIDYMNSKNLQEKIHQQSTVGVPQVVKPGTQAERNPRVASSSP